MTAYRFCLRAPRKNEGSQGVCRRVEATASLPEPSTQEKCARCGCFIIVTTQQAIDSIRGGARVQVSSRGELEAVPARRR